MHRALAIAFAMLLFIAACGDDGGSGTTVPATAAPTSPATDPPATSAPSGLEPGAAVAVGSTDLGDHLVDGAGRTLYLFTVDPQGGDTSACSGDCAATWPPLTGDVAAGDGVDGGLLGSVTRDDGSTQVTYNGWPLYYFAADAAPGDTNGQGVGDVWFVVSPAGDAIP